MGSNWLIKVAHMPMLKVNKACTVHLENKNMIHSKQTSWDISKSAGIYSS